MKKILLFMSAVAMFAAVSCNKVEINEPQIETPSVNEAVGSLEFVAYTEAETKTTLNGLATEWEAEDGIDVNGFSYTTYESGAKVIFKLEDGNEGEIPEAPYTAGYPSGLVYNNYNREPDCAGTLNFNFSNEHTLTAGEICDDVLAIAYSESDMSLHFKNVVSLIKFRVPAVDEDITEIKFSANEPLAGDIAVNYNDGKPTWAIDGDESFNELVLTPSSDNFVAGDDIFYYVPVLPGNKTNLTVTINEKVVATGIALEFKRNVIHYVGTLPSALPWAIAGTFNGWSTTANPMVKEGDYYVARNITGLNYTAPTGEETGSSTGFKFVVNGGDWKGSVGEMAAGAWEYVWDKDNGSNIYVTGAEASTAYDIYVNPSAGDNGKFVIVPAGTAMPEDIPVHEWAVAGTFNGWSVTANPMVKEGDYYVARNITGLNYTAPTGEETGSSTGFKFVQNGKVWKGSGENGGVMTVGSWSWIWGDNGSNICVDGAEASTAYDIYLDPSKGDNGKFVIVPTGTAMPEDVPAEDPSTYSWGICGHMTSWGESPDIPMTFNDENEWFVAENVVVAADQAFKLRANGTWAVNRGAGGEVAPVTVTSDVEIEVYHDGQDMTVAAGTYNFYLSKDCDKFKVESVGVTPEVTPGLESEWALAGTFNSWGNEVFLTTNVADIFVAKNLTLDAGDELKVKAADSWDVSYGGGIKYLQANKWMTVYSNGANVPVAAAGTYDVYFDLANTKLYLMNVGTSYTSATEQNTDGPTPAAPSNWFIVGNFNGWDPAVEAYRMSDDGTYFIFDNFTAVAGCEMKFAPGKWSGDKGASGSFSADQWLNTGSSNIAVPAGTYKIYFKKDGSQYKFEKK